MANSTGVLEIHSNENEAIVRFRSQDFPDDSVIEQTQQELDAYLDGNNCEILTFNLDGVVIIPSTMLGLLLAYRQRGFRIRIVNPSEHVIAVLKVTKLTTKIEVDPDIAS
ncbi:MAG: hypothetical protein KDA84_08365 [Planctomycetaceae bacterium]|nr:hypothetical protein [Planctomycetaceae bacterium]